MSIKLTFVYQFKILMKFCSICENLLEQRKKEGSNLYQNYCQICDKYYDLTDKVLFQKTKVSKKMKLEILINAALYDPTFPIIKYKCPKCDNDKVTYVVPEETMINVYVCRGCKSYWMK